MASFDFKRESTFSSTATYVPEEGGLPNLIGCVIQSSILDSERRRYPLTCVLAEDGMTFTMSATSDDTAKWSFGDTYWDIKVTLSDGVTVVYSDTVNFSTVAQVTL